MSTAGLINGNLEFICSCKWKNNEKEEWSGEIAKVKTHGHYVELLIISRSTIYVLCGKGDRGFWACIPDYQAGCNLSCELNDVFYNTEKLLTAIKNKVDAITIAKALSIFSEVYTF